MSARLFKHRAQPRGAAARLPRGTRGAPPPWGAGGLPTSLTLVAAEHARSDAWLTHAALFCAGSLFLVEEVKSPP